MECSRYARVLGLKLFNREELIPFVTGCEFPICVGERSHSGWCVDVFLSAVVADVPAIDRISCLYGLKNPWGVQKGTFVAQNGYRYHKRQTYLGLKVVQPLRRSALRCW